MVGTSTSSRRMGSSVRRGRMRRAGESAFGLLLLVRNLLVGLLVLLVVAAGFWASWQPARDAMDASRRGTMTVTHCSDDRCTGSYSPAARTASSGPAPRHTVVLEETVGVHKGTEVQVGTAQGDEVVRAGWAGLVRAYLPLGGALLLAAVMIAGGLRLRRTAWVTGLLGLALLAGAAFTL